VCGLAFFIVLVARLDSHYLKSPVLQSTGGIRHAVCMREKSAFD